VRQTDKPKGGQADEKKDRNDRQIDEQRDRKDRQVDCSKAWSRIGAWPCGCRFVPILTADIVSMSGHGGGSVPARACLNRNERPPYTVTHRNKGSSTAKAVL
jgi:hypothetical protein